MGKIKKTKRESVKGGVKMAKQEVKKCAYETPGFIQVISYNQDVLLVSTDMYSNDYNGWMSAEQLGGGD